MVFFRIVYKVEHAMCTWIVCLFNVCQILVDFFVKAFYVLLHRNSFDGANFLADALNYKVTSSSVMLKINLTTYV